MGKRRRLGTREGGAAAPTAQYWCYYCNSEARDNTALLRHQQAKHFRCPHCDPKSPGGHCRSLSGLIAHVRRSHGREVTEVPGAIEGRQDVSVEVYGMSGIPGEEAEEEQPQNEVEREPDLAHKPVVVPPPPGGIPPSGASPGTSPLAQAWGRWLHSSGGEIVVSPSVSGGVTVQHYFLGEKTMDASEFLVGGRFRYCGHEGTLQAGAIRWSNGSTWTKVTSGFADPSGQALTNTWIRCL
uniref:BED-type domain-containing protein n=1 Tax=Pyrodinium bahamense TaxID=73915 RepID=A0A7R9ZV90_9DINO|mmetsp:Transcript_11302/g.30830  ORF Transcript_11302/g.30830 Transcript_11302/m.30830 type:complete len:240 (+) Transcript_11302:111-830(+)|eukprot:CAMPEP_0179117412 /NCGR_PEP_ID=MMETSP0796-20121207/55147_1 /TAXON_ID=73915 /ORGANISM="Pyrodinium bahamense, Strain pbaha01" /LENGTH=239 /DNA_ID=CAMNT_0020815783 /DNA_START=37 /DNA_END=756 /DNA_ORIENTATION=-